MTVFYSEAGGVVIGRDHELCRHCRKPFLKTRGYSGFCRPRCRENAYIAYHIAEYKKLEERTRQLELENERLLRRVNELEAQLAQGA